MSPITIPSILLLIYGALMVGLSQVADLDVATVTPLFFATAYLRVGLLTGVIFTREFLELSQPATASRRLRHIIPSSDGKKGGRRKFCAWALRNPSTLRNA